MSTRTIYRFKPTDINKVITFCRDYHLDITKQASGRTGSGPRGLGGEIDAFGPGKLNEIAVSKLLSAGNKKRCLVDNQIYSNYEVGIKTIPDIVGVIEHGGIQRKPKLYIEVKKISESDQWLGIHSDQLNSILRSSEVRTSQIILIFAEVYFQDNKSRKQQDFLGAFLKSSDNNSSVTFEKFSDLDDLRCKIHYIINIRDLQKYGHEFKAGDIIPECNFAEAKQVYRSNGNLWKGLRITKTLNGENKINAPGVDGKKYSYGDFICKGNVQLIKKIGSSRTYLSLLSDTTLSSDYFGELKLKKGEIVFFNIKNKLAGLQGAKVKSKSDWWISKGKLEQIISNGVLDTTEHSIEVIKEKI